MRRCPGVTSIATTRIMPTVCNPIQPLTIAAIVMYSIPCSNQWSEHELIKKNSSKSLRRMAIVTNVIPLNDQSLNNILIRNSQDIARTEIKSMLLGPGNQHQAKRKESGEDKPNDGIFPNSCLFLDISNCND